MSRRQAILETLLVFAIFCLQGAWPVPDVNEPYYIGKAIHFWNPQWASGDWFLKTADAHTFFFCTTGWLSLLLGSAAFAWTLRLITWALLAWSWQRLSAAVAPRAWLAPLTAAIFLFLWQHFNMAGEWVVGGAESKGFAFALAFFALAAMATGRWNRMWLLLGLSTAFHALVGGWTAIAAGAVWFAANPKARLHLSSWLAPLAAFLVALPGILPPLLMNRGVDRNTIARAEQIYVYMRFPHHLDPVKMWSDGFVVPFLVMTAVLLLLWRTTAYSAAARRLFGFTVAALALAAIGAVFGLLTPGHRELAARWLRFYWFRLADVAVPLGVSLLGVRWFAERKMRAAMAMAIVVAALHAVDCAVLRLFADPPFGERQVDGVAWRAACLWTTGRPVRPLFPRQPRADKLRNYGDWLDVCRWIADPRNTPPDACFLIPRNAQTFRWYTARGEVGNWKDAPQGASSLVEWRERIHDIYATGNSPPQEEYFSSLADAGAARLRDLAEKYGADYLVTQVSTPQIERELHVVYRNDSFEVFKMR
jgi:hypothetical protein